MPAYSHHLYGHHSLVTEVTRVIWHAAIWRVLWSLPLPVVIAAGVVAFGLYALPRVFRVRGAAASSRPFPTGGKGSRGSRQRSNRHPVRSGHVSRSTPPAIPSMSSLPSSFDGVGGSHRSARQG